MNTVGVIDFQIGLEERISKIYGMIANLFSLETPTDAEWVTLWRELSVDEQNHASLLSIEKTFLQTGTHVKKPIEIGREIQQTFEAMLTRCEARVQSKISRKDAMKILKELENSEVNKLFSSLLKVTDSKVLSHLADFSRTHIEHDRRIQAAVEKYGENEHSVPNKMGGKEAEHV
ncbi:MAG: hypothetical protein ACE5GK_07385 [Nitrospiria bacterium]